METSEVNIPQPESVVPKPEGSSNILRSGADKLLSFFHRNEKKIEENPREVLEAVANDNITVETNEPDERMPKQVEAKSEVIQPETSENSEMTIDQAAALVSEANTDKKAFTHWKDLASEWVKNPAVLSGVFAAGLGLSSMIGNIPMGEEASMALQMVSRAITAEGGIKSKIAKALIASGASDLVSEMVGNEVIETAGEEVMAKGREVVKTSETAQKVGQKVGSVAKWGRSRMEIRTRRA